MKKKTSSGATAVGATAVEKDATREPAAPTNDAAHPARPGAKNRPTPKRRDQEAARRRPLVETDRKAARAAEKERAREARARQRAAADRGEESALPLRDRGPEKRYIRDRVDARLSLGEVAMPLMFILIFSWFLLPKLAAITLALVWVIVLAGLIDSALLWRRIKKDLIAKFGAVPRGGALYAVTRSMQMRRLRFPRPTVKRGDTVA